MPFIDFETRNQHNWMLNEVRDFYGAKIRIYQFIHFLGPFWALFLEPQIDTWTEYKTEFPVFSAIIIIVDKRRSQSKNAKTIEQEQEWNGIR